MKIPPFYQITSEMLERIAKIDSYRLYFSSLSIPIDIKIKIQRISLLKSSLFSARIEGNPLTIETISTSPDEQKKKEIFNIEKGTTFIKNQVKHNDKISLKLTLQMHHYVMKDIRSDGGQFRREMSAVFNQAGVAIYVPPSPLHIKELLKSLLHYINGKTEKFPLIKAFISHLVFEKIHPFIDGNGRVGRLLIYAIFKSSDYDFGFFIPFEEYLDKHKSDYYNHLDIGMKQTNTYLMFMLNAFLEQLEEMKKLIESEIKKKIMLPPRQEEIYNIIKDHPLISFDFIRRRFLKVPERTLRYDLKKLVDQNLIVKIGKTRGSYYKSI